MRTSAVRSPRSTVRVVAAHALAELAHRVPEPRPQRLAHHGRTHQQVGVAAPVFGEREHRDVDAPVERPREHRRSPCVVDHREHAAFARDHADRRDVLHLEGIASRALEPDQLRLGPDQRVDARADGGVVPVVVTPSRASMPSQKTRVGPYAESVASRWSPGPSTASKAVVIAASPEGISARAHRVAGALDVGECVHQRHRGRRAGGTVGACVTFGPCRPPRRPPRPARACRTAPSKRDAPAGSRCSPQRRAAGPHRPAGW